MLKEQDNESSSMTRPTLREVDSDNGVFAPASAAPAANGESPVQPMIERDTPVVIPGPTATSASRFINRELSWLEFNRRVLEEAQNMRHPLLERLRFLSISASNLDEFYMVRVAGLKGMVNAGVASLSDDGLTPAQQLARVDALAAALVADQQQIWRELRTAIANAGIAVIEPVQLVPEDRVFLDKEFAEEIFPILTPLAIDPAHPFPFIPNLGFVMALRLTHRAEGKMLTALLPVPSQLKRFIRLPARDGKARFHHARKCDWALSRQAVPRACRHRLGHVPHPSRQRH